MQIKIKNRIQPSVNAGETLILQAEVVDDSPLDSLTTEWKASGGTFTAKDSLRAEWVSPSLPGAFWIYFTATDQDGLSGTDSLQVHVANRPPTILSLDPDSAAVVLGNLLKFRCTAIDSDGHALQYDWLVSGGQIVQASGDSMQWRAPESPGKVGITVIVRDTYAAETRDTARVVVYREGGTVWIADTGNRQVVKVSAEGGILLRKGGFLTPDAIAIDPVRRQVWVADVGRDELYLLDLRGALLATLSDLGGPTDVAVNTITGSAWVVESDSNRVREIAQDGTTILRQVVGFKAPQAVAINPKAGDLYIADTGNHRVVYLHRAVPDSYHVEQDSSHHLIYSGFTTPVEIEYDFSNHVIWVADPFDGKVFWFADTASVRSALSGLRTPRAVAVDPFRSLTWIANTGKGEILRWQYGKVTRIVGGFLLPQALAVDPVSGVVWIADTENDRIVKIDSRGNKEIEIYGFSSPRAVAVNSGQ